MLSAQQLELRRGGLGGSDMGAVLGLDPWRRPIDVYQEKTRDGPVTVAPPTDAQHFGNLLEPVVADEFARRNGCQVIGPFGTKRVESRPWHLYSLDRVILRDGDMVPLTDALPASDRLAGVLEIKTAGLGGYRRFGHDGTDELPPSILVQCAWYLAATGLSTCHVAALLTGNDYREYVVERDLGLEADILEKGERFWRNVESRTPPPADGSQAFTDYVRQRFDKTVDCVVTANPVQAMDMAVLRRVRAYLSVFEKRKTLAEQRLALAIADADGIEGPDGKITFRFDKRGKVNYRTALHDLAERYQVPPDELQAVCEAHRGTPPRKFLTPRAWADDAAALEQELADGTQERQSIDPSKQPE